MYRYIGLEVPEKAQHINDLKKELIHQVISDSSTYYTSNIKLQLTYYIILLVMKRRMYHYILVGSGRVSMYYTYVVNNTYQGIYGISYGMRRTPYTDDYILHY
jgi:hypothetical protein